MKLNSHNEWDPLKAVIVGTVEGFAAGLELADPRPGVLEAAVKIAAKAYPQWYLDEVAEDLEGLCRLFQQAGVSVIRPCWSEKSPSFQTPNWIAAGFDIYNVRDLHIVFGDTLVVSAPSSRFRLFETYAFHDTFYRHFFEDGLRWISAPLPRLKGEYVHEIQRPPSNLEATEDCLHQTLVTASARPTIISTSTKLSSMPRTSSVSVAMFCSWCQALPTGKRQLGSRTYLARTIASM